EEIHRACAERGFDFPGWPPFDPYLLMPWVTPSPTSFCDTQEFACSFVFPQMGSDRIVTSFEFNPATREGVDAAVHVQELDDSFQGFQDFLITLLRLFPYCDFPHISLRMSRGSKHQEAQWEDLVQEVGQLAVQFNE